MKADRDDYIRFAMEHDQTRLICYGVVLADKQKAAIHGKIDEFLSESKLWQPDPEKNLEQYTLTQDAKAA